MQFAIPLHPVYKLMCLIDQCVPISVIRAIYEYIESAMSKISEMYNNISMCLVFDEDGCALGKFK